MAKSRGFTISRLLDVVSSGKEADGERVIPITLFVMVDSQAPRDLVEAVRDALVAQSTEATVHVTPLSSGVANARSEADVAIVILGADHEEARNVALAWARAGVPTAFLAESTLEAPALGPDVSGDVASQISVVSGASCDVAIEKLADWLIETTDKPLAFAANFPFVRPALVSSLTLRCSAENAAVGAVDLIHGSDFPLMIVNQAKLALDLSAAHGKKLGAESLIDIATVLVAGLAWRALSRNASRVLPVGGWLVRGGFGFAGTAMTARLIDARLSGELGQMAKEALSRVRPLLEKKASKGGPKGQVALARRV